MFRQLTLLAHRRPVLLVTLGLYATISALVARSPLTVALCVVVLVVVAGQVALALRTSARPAPVDVVTTP